jgi:Skp family chaperone for outer membrane proteins
MMTLNKILYVLIIAAALVAHPLSVRADETKMAVVDVEKILSESKAGKSIQAQLNSRRETFQKEFSKRENDLMNAEKALVQQKPDLSADAFEKKRQEFERNLLETRSLFQKRRNSLDKGLGDALATLRKNIVEVIAEISDKENYQIVLTRDSVVIVEKEMDITETVLARLDKKITNIKLDVAE